MTEEQQCGCLDCKLHEGRCQSEWSHRYTVTEGNETVDAKLCEPCGDLAIADES